MGQCRIREQNRDFGIIPERENLFSLRGLIAKIQESYPANESVVIQKGGREIPSRIAREHRADTIPNEMRHVGQSESRSCAVIERDDGRKNHNSYSIVWHTWTSS